ncbi:MAG TPA: hypothetical protein VES97_01580, partial [Solirubrobacteraceae bacterium]|nr:hypothetical protein [Solirubrobacteraceae bacterium]
MNEIRPELLASRWILTIGDVPSMFALSPPARHVLSRVSGLCFATVVIAFVAYSAHIVYGLGGRSSDGVFNDVVYNAIMLGASLALIMRAASRTHDRLALLLIGVG